ncbi:hypothetical protein B0J17DRAFT_298531 [Rhizoctonia solani]|nr:hypothetical protein B0J17DRAFT_298531 [Rhizoctonia solani]
MSTLPHPRWGRALGPGSYASVSDVGRSTLSVEVKFAGLQAMEDISHLAVDQGAYTRTQTDRGTNIHLSSLKDALSLASDPATIHHLVNPPLISGCIQLMQTIINQTPGVISPISYECGYLCFRLLGVALDTCLMREWGKLDDTSSICLQYPLTSPQFVASSELSLAIEGRLSELQSRGDSHWVLNWSVSNNPNQQTALLPRVDIAALWDILWTDRKHFLQA